MKRYIYIIFTLLLFTTCDKDREEIIPNVSFFVSINLDDPRYSSRNTFIVVDDVAGNRAGINGVVVYRLTNNTYYAFDLMCTNEKQPNCLVKIKDDITCECPYCKSQFLIATPYGDVISGKAPWPLKAYKTSLTGGGTILNIWN
jgi:nitrite reductase/ring-hydroxylating ferredoxin subunit